MEKISKMKNKLVGSEIDFKQHQDLLLSFTEFIKNFSPLLDNVEEYYQNMISLKLIDNNDEVNQKIEVIEEMTNCLTQCIPIFVQFSILENKLDLLNKQA